MDLKKGDNVIVVTGKDKGKKGKIARVLRGADRVIVEGLNLAKRRLRPRRAGEKGQIVEVATPMHQSNVMVFCAKCGRGARLGHEFKKDKKVRVCVKCRQTL